MKKERRSGTNGKLNVLSDREYKRLAKHTASMAITATLAASVLCAPALAVTYNVTDGTVIVENKEDTILSWQDGANAKYAESNPYNHNENMDNTINITGGTTANQVLHVGSGTTGVDENESLDINIGSTDNGVIASVKGDNVIKVEENEGDETKVNISIKNSILTSKGGSAAIDVDGHTNVDIEKSNISGGGSEHAAIEVKGESKAALENSNVTGSGTGVQVQDSATLIIGGAEIQAGELILTPVPQENAEEYQGTTITSTGADIEMKGGDLVLDANAGETGLEVEVNGDSTAHLSEGTYNDLQFTVNDSMLTVEYEGQVTMQGAGDDAAVTVNVGTTEEDAAIGVTFESDSLDNTLTMDHYMNGVRSESVNEASGNVEINFQEGSNVTIQNSVGDSGNAGSGIFLNNYGNATINIGVSEETADIKDESAGKRIESAEDVTVETKVELTNNGLIVEKTDGKEKLGSAGAGIFTNIKGGTFALNLESSEVHIDGNAFSGLYGENTPNMNILIQDSYLTASGNGGSGLALFPTEATLNASDSFIKYIGNKGGNGISRGYQTYTNSTVIANGNSDCNIKANTLTLNNTSVTANCAEKEDGIYVNDQNKDGKTPSLLVKNSTIEASNNAGKSKFDPADPKQYAGIRVEYDGLIESSHVTVNGNAGPDGNVYGLGVGGTITIRDSFFQAKDEDYAIYMLGDDAKVQVEGASVVALDGEKNAVYGTSANQKFVVNSGSVQVNPDDMKKDDGINKAFDLDDSLDSKDFNGLKDEGKIYLAPINEDDTMLTPFKLSELVDKGRELTSLGDGIWRFTYCDPNTGKEYEYTFRYNAEGEDLLDEDGGNAYIWVPVSVVKYDPTQGSMDEESLGTAKLDEDGYAYDMTVYGHSLALAERTMAGDAVAKDGTIPDGYTFQGWYVQFVDGKVKEIKLDKDPTEMTQEDWDAIYAQLNKEFGVTSLVSTDLANAQNGTGKITIYAKWGAAPSGGSGGGEETPTPTPDPDDGLELILTPVPTEEEIPQTETPLTDAPVEEIPEEETPLADAPVVDESLEEIGEENVPLASAPKTGDESGVFGLMAALSGMALTAMSFIDRKGRHARFGCRH